MFKSGSPKGCRRDPTGRISLHEGSKTIRLHLRRRTSALTFLAVFALSFGRVLVTSLLLVGWRSSQCNMLGWSLNGSLRAFSRLLDRPTSVSDLLLHLGDYSVLGCLRLNFGCREERDPILHTMVTALISGPPYCLDGMASARGSRSASVRIWITFSRQYSH